MILGLPILLPVISLICMAPVRAARDPEAALLRDLGGTPDPDARGGEAKTLDQPGIYCWWSGPKIRPGYFEITARARATGEPGVIHFVLTESRDEKHFLRAVSEVQRGRVESREYQEIYCGTFYWDGSFGMRVSDWSSPGLMVDWVKLVPVAASEVRDPLPGVRKRYDAPRFRTPPEVDGKLTEWAGVPILALGEESARSAAYGGTADLSGICHFAWDATHLYFACEVVDNEAQFLDDIRYLSGIWKYDSIQVAFDAARDARTPGYAGDDYEYGLGLTPIGGKAYRWVAGHGLRVGDVPTVDVAVVRDEDLHLTRYEAAIPFKELVPFSPERPLCGMTLIINDRDGGKGQRAWLEWTPGIAGAKDPSAFGELHLVDAPPGDEGVTALLVAQRDLSGKAEATATLRVRAPRALGACLLRWRIGPEGTPETQLAAEDRRAELSTPDASLRIPLSLERIGEGRFELSAQLLQGEDVLASASMRFHRFAIDPLRDRLAEVTRRLERDLARIDELRHAGLPAQYPRATLGAVEEFVRYTGEDIEEAYYERAEMIMRDLEVLLGEAEAEMADLQAHPERDLPVPDLPRERITARDGCFYAAGEPQILIGYCGWWQVWSRVQPLAEQGLNHLEDSIIAPFALFPDAGETPDEKMMEGLAWAWDKADQAGICYSRMLACNQVPDSFRDKLPSATGGGWSGLCPLDPALRQFQQRYLGTVARTAAPHPSLGVHVLYGENQYRLSDHPLEVAAFSQYLQDEYRTLDALNAAWDTAFERWEDIGTSQDVPSPVAWHDRGRFGQRLFADWTAWLREQVKSVDPQALCTAYPSLLSWDDTSDFTSGIDLEALCRTLDVNGFDTAALEYGGKRWAMSSITGFAMPHDMVKAFSPANPNYDPELHLVNLNQPYPDEYVRAAMFQGCFHGLLAANLWVFQRNEGMDSMLVFQPRVMAAYLRVGLDLRRLIEPVLAFQRAPSEVAILYSLTSVAYNPRHLPEMRAVYEGTFFLDTKVSFVTERTVREGGLDRLKLLIVPEASHLPAPAAQAVVRWSQQGGRLVLAGECLRKDERNRPLTDVGLNGRSVLRVEASGDPTHYSTTLAPVLRATMRRPYRAVDGDGQFLDGVEMRTTVGESGRLFYAINMNKTAVTFDLSPRPQGALVELLHQQRAELPISLQPLDVVILLAEK